MNKNHEVKSFFDQTHKYLHKDFGVQVRKEIAHDLLAHQVAGKRIIDLGCGNGDVSLQFLPVASAVHFLDISDKMLQLVQSKIPADQQHKVAFFNCDLEMLEVTEKYDIIIAYGLIMHVNSPEKAVAKMGELLTKDGLLLIQYTNARHLITKANKLLKPKGSYSLNLIDYPLFVSIARQTKLQIINSFRYSLLLAGLGKIPNHILYRFHKFTYTNKLVSKLGMDHVFLLKKI